VGVWGGFGGLGGFGGGGGGWGGLAERLAGMRVAAREFALGMSWDAVFEGVYAGYEAVVGAGARG